MRLGVQRLETVSTLARDGSEAAAKSLSQLTNTDVAVEVTQVELVSRTAFAESIAGTPVVGAAIELRDGLDGTVVVVFDESNATMLLESIMPTSWAGTTEEFSESGITETANIMAGGFIDAWADHFETRITPEPPTYLAGEWPAVLPDTLPAWADGQSVLSLTSQLTAPAETIDFQLYFFPDQASLEQLIDAAGPIPVSVEKLAAFNALAGIGARRAAEKVTTMTSIETTVDITRLTFIPTDSVSQYPPATRRIGAVTHLNGPPGGHIAILFDPQSAQAIGDALLPVATDGEEVTDQHRMALQELSNIMISGFIDGWANTVERKIQHVPPEVVDQSGATIITDLAADTKSIGGHLFVFDSTVYTPDQTINCELVAVPDPDAFESLLAELSAEDVSEAVADPTTLEPRGYDDLQE